MADALRLNVGAPMPIAVEGTLSYTNQALGTIDYKVGWVHQMPFADTITHLGFRYGARTATPPQHTISLQGLGTTGLPDGTILGGGSPASATFTPPADTSWDGLWQWVALANSYAAARGEKLAVVIDCTSSPAGGSSSYTRNNGNAFSYLQGLPYHVINTGSWAKGVSSYQCIYGLKSASRVYGVPIQSLTQQATSTTGRRCAMKFTLPSGWGTSFEVLGFRMVALAPVNGSTYKVGLWNAAGTALQSQAAIDSDSTKSPSANGSMEFYFSDTTLATLAFGTTYYIGLECESSATIRMATLDSAASGDLLAWPLGTNACYSLWDGAAWNDTATSRPWLELILNDITPPSGGSGGVIGGPNMRAGMMA